MLIRVIADNVRTITAVQSVDTVPKVGDVLELDEMQVVVRAVLATSRESTIAGYVYVNVVRR